VNDGPASDAEHNVIGAPQGSIEHLIVQLHFEALSEIEPANCRQRTAGRNEGRPGAYTPGSLFGPELVAHAGGQFILDRGKRALIQAGGAGTSRRVLAAMRPSLFDQVADHRR
jgi:hypothetical protein